jgi:hypothetical protein
LVFHDQDVDISSQIERLNNTLVESGLPNDIAIHSGPIIRNEDEFRQLTLEDRHRLFDRLLTFARISKVKHKAILIKKREYPSRNDIVGRISRELSLFLNGHLDYFQAFDKINVYYDFGQSEVSRIISTVFNALFFEVDMRKAEPQEYRLFQAADMLCSLELLNEKAKENKLTHSELLFFKGRRRLVKNYLKSLEKMRF